MKYVTAFIRFWYDFIVGDSAVLAAGGIGLIALGYGLVEADVADMAQVLLPLAVVTTLIASLPIVSRR